MTRGPRKQSEWQTPARTWDGERLRRIAADSFDMIAELDADWRVLYVNDRVEAVLGTPEGGDWPSIVVHPDDLPRVQAAVERARNDGVDSNATYRLRHIDGDWRWIEARYRPLTTPDGERRVLVIARDRSHDVDAELRLAASEARYRELVEKSPVGILVLQDDCVAFANAEGAAVCGASSPSDLVGTRVDALLERSDVFRTDPLRAGPGLPPDDRLLELNLRGLDGQVRAALATGTRIEFEGAPAFQALVRDITRLRETERERKRLELQLQESRKLESLGMLAGGIAHDFNNLLAVILANARFALRTDGAGAELTEALEETIEAGERAARLTRQLLDYAGRRTPDVRTTDIGALVDATSDILRSAIPNHVALDLELDPDAPPVRADVVQIEQVLMNLVINAADAIGEGAGRVRVATGTTEIRPGHRRPLVEGGTLHEGLYTFLEVSDTGRGMDADTQARVFEPFFTTKAHGHGLGLAAVIGLVQGHDGAVELASTPGEGTRFRVYLPAATELSVASGAEPGHAVLWLGSLDALREDSSWGRYDATPLPAVGEPDALARLSQGDRQIALLVVDGQEIGDAARFLEEVELRAPGLPVLWCGELPDAVRAAAGPLECVSPGQPLREALESLLGKP